MVIEAKRAEYSLKVGIPQALAYMLANPELQKPAFGFVTNGGEFIFLKAMQRGLGGFPHERLHQDTDSTR
ncbi:hypothetical protein BJP34_11025 [Moorena producens PAL-8-15-08-1]|uniref:Uncharacterized protein n=1 Tax=Moorena producens PAL-8-15-08-1 TaxID=1458985 RepID=A0A1D8TQR3_9CYAN|nr:hypothetical protein BJP34_11025 [Moorena producens PAL-8-15-08-1]